MPRSAETKWKRFFPLLLLYNTGGTYFDGAIHRAREKSASLNGQTGHTTLMSHQSLRTRHVFHIPHLNNNNNNISLINRYLNSYLLYTFISPRTIHIVSQTMIMSNDEELTRSVLS